MGMVRRRTRRRTMMVAGGLAYERGQNAQATARPGLRRARPAARSASAGPRRTGTGRRRRSQRDRAAGVTPRLRRADRRRVRGRQSQHPRHLATAQPATSQ